MNRQLPLALSLNPQTTFKQFCFEGNELLQSHMLQLSKGMGERFIYIWGSPGSGKSHLLQGCCQAFHHCANAVYLPLQQWVEWGPSSIEGMQASELIALDDMDAIAGKPEWEEGLFHFYNQVRGSEQGRLLISGSCPPSQLPLQLPDLRSRLGWGLVIHVQELADDIKIHVLQQEALQRGFSLSDGVAQFLIHRCTRNLHDLKHMIARLDEASLAAKRKITIPFVKVTLGI